MGCTAAFSCTRLRKPRFLQVWIGARPLLRRRDDDALARALDSFARFPLPHIHSCALEDFLVHRAVFLLDRTAERPSLDADLDVLIFVDESHGLGSSLPHPFHE